MIRSRFAGGLIAVATIGTAPVAAAAVPGSLDTSFSGDGKVTTKFEYGSHYVGGLALQPDGKIVVAGQVKQFDGRFALARYNPDGTLDQTWGGDGRVETNFTRGTDGAFAVAVQSDGKVVAAGFAARKTGRFAVVRYTQDGRLDKTFSGDGKKATNFGTGRDYAFAVAIQPDGTIVAAGGARLFATHARFALVRYTQDGKLDKTFGVDGKVATKLSELGDAVFGLAMQANGKIVAAGGASGFIGDPNFALARYWPDGTLDSSFDGDGKVTTGFGGLAATAAHGLAVQSDGKIVAAGVAADLMGSESFALARYGADGSLDSSFSGDGLVRTKFGSSSFGSGAYGGLAIQPDGKIVAAGEKALVAFAIARYTIDGTLDSSFGGGDGKVTTVFAAGSATAQGIAIKPDGKIVAAGDLGEGDRFAVTRYVGG